MPKAAPIAIVSMGGVFPGANTLDEFARRIFSGQDAMRAVPPGRWILDPRDAYDPSPQADKAYSDRACFVENFEFDPSGLDLDPNLLRDLDPLYHLTLHAGRQAWTAANVEDVDSERVGVMLAAIALPTDGSSAITRDILGQSFARRLLGDRFEEIFDKEPAPNPLNARVTALPAGLLAAGLNLRGGSLTLDAACASSLYAVKLACDELREGRADAMLAGGVSRPEALYTQMGFSRLQALSPSGRCRPFDANADGLVVGEGVGVVVLKRLEDALRHDDEILGVIRGIGLSNDIAGSLLAADSEGQLRAMRAAYEQAGWSPESVDLIECHGTGTPVGDAAEIKSMHELWDGLDWRQGQCALGSVKAVIGHLLTAAGAAGLIKVLLALQEERLPPSAYFETPVAGFDLEASPFSLPAESIPWPRRDDDAPRRAAVSAFGFGGINAHVLVEEWRPKQSARHVPVRVISDNEAEREPVAVVGLDACAGSLRSLDEFQQAVLSGASAIALRSPARWRGCEDLAAKRLGPGDFPGAYIDELSIDAGRFRLPPNEIPETLPQQMLMLQVVARALADAGLDARDRRERAGIIVGMGLDLNTTNYHHRWVLLAQARRWAKMLGLDLTDDQLYDWIGELRESAHPALNAPRVVGALGNIIASRIAREFAFGGTSYAISAEEASGLRALDVCVRALQRGELDLAVAGAVDLSGDLRAVSAADALRRFSRTDRPRPFDARSDGPIVGEGAVALVLKRLSDAHADGDDIYAIVRGQGFAGGDLPGQPSPRAYELALQRAYADAGLRADSVGYIETHGSGDPAEDQLEAQALNAIFDEETLAPAAIGSLKANIGHAGAAAGLLSCAKAALCLKHRVIPPLVGYETPADPDAWSAGQTHLPNRAQHWLQDRAAGPHRAGVSSIGLDGACAHVVLEEYESSPVDGVIQPATAREYGVFAIVADDLAGLQNKLGQLSDYAEAHPAHVERIARGWFEKSAADAGRLCVAVVARDADELSRAVGYANAKLSFAADTRVDGREGVYYNPNPLGPDVQTAFVFPGSGCHYLGMGRELALAFPDVLRRLDQESERLAAQFLPAVFAPWRTDWPADWRDSSRAAMNADHVAMIQGQVAFGVLMSDVLQRLGLRSDAALGYSLGETASLFALRAWRDRDEMQRRMAVSPLFRTELTGECRAARRVWKLSKNETVDWRVVAVNAPAEDARAAVADLDRVYVLIRNTPDECVIGGQASAVDEAVKRLNCDAIELTGASTVHCEIARAVKDEYRALHLLDVTAPKDIRIYSAAAAQDYKVKRESAADSILAQALDGFDFPALVERAYADGARVFIEAGPHNSCSRMIRRILADRPHFAQSANTRGEDEVAGVLKLIAGLLAERVLPDLAGLYGVESSAMEIMTTATGQSRKTITLPTGAEPPHPQLPLKNRVTAQASRPLEEVVPIPTTVPAQPTEYYESTHASVVTPNDMDASFNPYNISALVAQTGAATAQAHQRFLAFSEQSLRNMADALTLQAKMLGASPDLDVSAAPASTAPAVQTVAPTPAPAYPREMCLEFAIGSAAKVLGPEFAELDDYPARVRLPDEPLMLVDRILTVAGEKASLTHGAVVTEHDVLSHAWYLDGGKAPVCITVEAGQADLFLCSYLGVDLAVKGSRTYRLLDAAVRFHRGLPRAGETIRYEINIDKFIRQGETYMFFFRFVGTIDGRPVITMTDGCAGFFTEEEIENSGGIVLTPEQVQPQPGRRRAGWRELVPMTRESYDETRLDALRNGELAACFGPAFAGLNFKNPPRLPGGAKPDIPDAERMRLVHRVVDLDPTGGRFSLGLIRAEADVHPDDWFLTCHFVDDMVMPGTLMYECCAHTLRIFLFRMGWVGEQDGVAYEPCLDVPAQLKCRGPVTTETKVVTYEVELKEIGYDPEPYVIADALMYADGRRIVQFTDMSMRITGLTREQIEAAWVGRDSDKVTDEPADASKIKLVGDAPLSIAPAPAVFDEDKILAFASGSLVDAFGEPYRCFDEDRRIARLPRPPFSFLTRVTQTRSTQWDIDVGGWIEAQYDVPPEAWYFAANRQRSMPFSVLLEIALQACGWLAAYNGSALKSRQDMRFRNLGGTARLHEELFPDAGTLTIRSRMTNATQAGDTLLQDYDMQVWRDGRIVYDGVTMFGFFTDEALAKQVGVRDAAERRYMPTNAEIAHGQKFELDSFAPLTPNDANIDPGPAAAMPAKAMRMVDHVELFIPDGGPSGLGYIRGVALVDPQAWFFQAHFFQDPVWPGSLGLEAFLQLLKVVALKRWPDLEQTHRFEPIALGAEHKWLYRGQILPTNERVVIEAQITNIQDGPQPIIVAAGFLSVDGVTIYEMTDFALRLKPVE